MLTIDCPDGPICKRYTETEERILKAFAAFITIEQGVVDNKPCLVLRFNHPEHQERIEIPAVFTGDFSLLKSGIDSFAKMYLQPSMPLDWKDI